MKEYKLLEQAQALQESIHDRTMNAAQIKEVEMIDILQEQFMKEAESKCEMKCLRVYKYLPALQHSVDHV